jgi:transposase
MNMDDCQDKTRRMDRVLKEPEMAADEIDSKIRELTDSDEKLKRRHELLLSADGRGKRTAVKMIVETGVFRNFDNAGKFCCHAGVAPCKV